VQAYGFIKQDSAKTSHLAFNQNKCEGGNSSILEQCLRGTVAMPIPSPSGDAAPAAALPHSTDPRAMHASTASGGDGPREDDKALALTPHQHHPRIWAKQAVAGKRDEIRSPGGTEHLHRASLRLTESFGCKAQGGGGGTSEMSKYTTATFSKWQSSTFLLSNSLFLIKSTPKT